MMSMAATRFGPTVLALAASALWGGCTAPKPEVGSVDAGMAKRAELGVPASLLGYWYMGTMMGEDCNLIVKQDFMLKVRFGGCFSSEPWVESPFQVEGDKIVLGESSLRRKFGKYLSHEIYKANDVLVPEVNKDDVSTNGFRQDHCFWRNLLGEKGLELPPDARDFDRRGVPPAREDRRPQGSQ